MEKSAGKTRTSKSRPKDLSNKYETEVLLSLCMILERNGAKFLELLCVNDFDIVLEDTERWQAVYRLALFTSRLFPEHAGGFLPAALYKYADSFDEEKAVQVRRQYFEESVREFRKQDPADRHSWYRWALLELGRCYLKLAIPELVRQVPEMAAEIMVMEADDPHMEDEPQKLIVTATKFFAAQKGGVI